MRNLATITLVGYVGRDPEARVTQTGEDIVSVSLAVTTRRGQQEETSWYTVSAFRGLAGVMQNYVKKGMPLFVQGTLQPRLFDGRDGTKHLALDVTAREVVLLSTREPGAAAEVPADAAEPAVDDGMPF